MKLLFVLHLAPTLTFAQGERITYIRQQFQETNTNVESFKKIENTDIDVYKDSNPKNYSFESTQIYRLAVVNMKRYYQGDVLVKVELTFQGDRQNLKSEYYFDEQGLLFTLQEQTDFDQPKWTNSFDETQKKVRENKFYFESGKLIRWVDETGNTNEKPNDKINERGRKVLSDARLYRNYKSN